MALTQHHIAPEPTGRDFPYRDTPAAELVKIFGQRYQATGVFDEAAAFEILGRFMVSEGLATDTGHWEGPYYVDEF